MSHILLNIFNLSCGYQTTYADFGHKDTGTSVSE